MHFARETAVTMHSKTILVLDHDVQRRTHIRQILSPHGYKVLEAGNPSEAQTICSRRDISIDLVIQDADVHFGLKWPRWRPCSELLLTRFSVSQAQNCPDDFGRCAFNPEQLLSKVGAVLRAESGVQDMLVTENDDIEMRGVTHTSGCRRNLELSVAQMEAAKPGTILMVEDDEFLRRAVSRALRRNGFAVIDTGDGSSAVALFSAHQMEIDVVLLDIMLPGMSGREVFEELERIRPDVKVILTTGFTEEFAMSTISVRQPSAFVRKPYRIADLVHSVRKIQMYGTNR
jgi:DNA-binding response OmpR family regulator